MEKKFIFIEPSINIDQAFFFYKVSPCDFFPALFSQELLKMC